MSLIPFGFWGQAGDRLIKTGLILYQDALNTASYSGTGTSWIDIINNITGSLQNGPVWNSAGYFTFDGVNDTMEYLSTNAGIYQFGIGNFTMSCWVFIPNVNQSWFLFRSRATTGFAEIAFGFGSYVSTSLSTGKKMTLGMIDSGAGNGRFVHSTDLANLGNWVNLTYVRDGGRSFKAYANGTELTLTATSNFGASDINVTTNANWRFSDLSPNGERFDDKVSEIWWYNRAITSAENLTNFNTTKSRYGL